MARKVKGKKRFDRGKFDKGGCNYKWYNGIKRKK